MPTERLSSLDASFLGVETPTAHMHVGWAALSDPPEEGPRPGFEQLREHIGRRLTRAPRCRQKVRSLPFGVNAPVWVDDGDFDISDHVYEAGARRLSDVVDECFSSPCPGTDRSGSCTSPPAWTTAASGSSARRTTAWWTGSPRSGWRPCSSIRAPRRRIRPRPTGSRPCLQATRDCSSRERVTSCEPSSGWRAWVGALRSPRRIRGATESARRAAGALLDAVRRHRRSPR